MTGVYLCTAGFWFCLLYYQLHLQFRYLGARERPSYDGTAAVLFFALLSTATVGFIWRFSYWFTGVVTRQKLHQIITFCYSCTFTGSLSPVLVVAIVLLLPPELFRLIALESPIGISLACSVPLPGEEPTAIPLDLQCGSETAPHYQWLLHVGGVASPQSLARRPAGKLAAAPGPAVWGAGGPHLYPPPRFHWRRREYDPAGP